MTTLPLFYYPNSWIWVDDDHVFLKTMTHIFSEENLIIPFKSSKACLDYLSQYRSPIFQQNFLKSSTENEKYGLLQYTPVDFDVTAIKNLADDLNRYNEITVMVIDYNMPEMDGFSLAEATSHLPIQKLLLTGKAQANQAIEGFNNKLIHRFIQKCDVDMEPKITAYLAELSIQYFQEITKPLLAHLETEAKLPLSDPIFIDFFERFCRKNQIKEYYLIDKQGSFLCIDTQGNRSCLVVHSERTLDAWISANEAEKYLSTENINLLREKKKIPFLGIGIEGWQVDPSEWPNHFFEPGVLEGREKYLWINSTL